jgi:hypothetical protein
MAEVVAKTVAYLANIPNRLAGDQSTSRNQLVDYEDCDIRNNDKQ